MKRLIVVILLFVTLNLYAGIGLIHETTAPDTEHSENRQEAVGITGLKGKTVVLDPGHGGSHPGAVGINGLRECDVNLSVGLYLAEMLKDAGANAILTRTADSDVYPDTTAPVGLDLRERVNIARNSNAEIFVSLHHNADANLDSTVNIIKTFYKMGDYGQSFDLARHIHKAMVENSLIKENELLQGNYFVLRNAPCPAALGEPSYISNPENELLLTDTATLIAEANAYFLGIKNYFDAGIPVAEILSPKDGTTYISAEDVEFRFTVSDETGGMGIDYNNLLIEVDGYPRNYSFSDSAGILSWKPDTILSNSEHVLSLTVKNLNGNSSKKITRSFRIDSPGRHVFLKAEFDVMPVADNSVNIIHINALDENLMPVIDGTELAISGVGCSVSDSIAKTINGHSAVYVYPEKEAKIINIVCSLSNGISNNKTITVSQGAPAITCIVCFKQNDTAPVSGVAISCPENKALYTNSDGIALLQSVYGNNEITLRKTGFIPKTMLINVDTGVPFSIHQIELTPKFFGIMHNKTIVIDPRYGGNEGGEKGPTGLRSADVNLECARYLKAFLEDAGARVLLTRNSDEFVPAQQKIMLSNNNSADCFVMINHWGKNTDTLTAVSESFHYPKSIMGKVLAEKTLACMARTLRTSSGGETEINVYELSQTSAPSVYVCPSNIINAEIENKLRNPKYVSREAYSIFVGLLHALSPDTARHYYVTYNADTATTPAFYTLNLAPNSRVSIGEGPFIDPNDDGIVEFHFFDTKASELIIEQDGVLIKNPFK